MSPVAGFAHKPLSDLTPGELQLEDMVDTVLLVALNRVEKLPVEVSLYPWLREAVRCVLDREVAGACRNGGGARRDAARAESPPRNS